MADKLLKFEIVTPEKVVPVEDVKHVKAPGIGGYFGVLPEHIHYITSLKIGYIEVSLAAGKKVYATSGGFTEVLDDKMVVLAETVEEATKIDIERAKASKERALKRLADKGPDIDLARAHLSLLRAINRIEVASKN